MESIFRHGPPTELREVPEAEPKASDSGGAPALRDVPEAHPETAGTEHGDSGGHKPHLAIPKSERRDAPQPAPLTGAELKALVATIPDDATVVFIDVGEGKRPHLVELLTGVAIVGKK